MRTRLHIQRKAPSKSSSSPVTNPFKSRPFASPTTDEEALPQQQPTPDLQAQPEKKQGSGYNFANVSVTPRDTAAPLMLQRKLTMGEPGDKYEQEADRMARQVVSQINAPVSPSSSQGETVQRDELPKDEEESQKLQAKPMAGTIQRDERPKPEEEELKKLQTKPMAGKIQQSPSGSIQRAWANANNQNVSTTNSSNMEILRDLVARVNTIPLSAGTIVPKRGSTTIRIDMQGQVRRGEDNWANIQCQVGEDSIAGVICPFDLDIAEVQQGLLQALNANDVLEWQVEAEAEEDEFEKWKAEETADAPAIELPRGGRLPYH